MDICSFSRIKLMVNQVEVHPFYQQEEAKKWMDKYSVQIEAWASFGEGRGNMFQNPVLNESAKSMVKVQHKLFSAGICNEA